MIRLGLRLTFGSGREAVVRVVVTAVAVALGVGLLLAALAGMNGLRAQTDRAAWLDSGTSTASRSAGGSAAGHLWWLSSIDVFGNQAIDRVDVAPVGASPPVPPGIAHLPGPGEYVVSPALAVLLRTTPANQLRDRFPGRQVGVIGPAGLPSPSSLIVVIGHRAAPLSHAPGVVKLSAIVGSAAHCYECQSVVGSGPILEYILAGGAVALLLPVLILIATASRLSATRREERFAAMRLVGATPHQVAVVSAVEAVVASVAGVALGFVVFYAWRPLLYHVPFTGQPLSPGDLSLTALDVAVAAVGVPLAAVVSARLALRRVQVSPLGVKRRVRSRPPRPVRVVPLALGVGLLGYFDLVGKPGAIGGQLLELLAGFLLLIVGLVLSGPWFTTAGARLMATYARRPASLIAGRRLLDNPKAAFRFVSGLVVALFVTSAVVGALSSIAAASSTGAGAEGLSTLADTFCAGSSTNCPPALVVRAVPPRVLADLRTTRGVTGVTVVHQSPAAGPENNVFGVVTCAPLKATPAIGRCAPGATAANVGWFLAAILGNNPHAATTTWPSADLSASDVARLPVDAVVVATDGSPGAVERARTALESAFPDQGTAVAVESLDPSTQRQLAMIQDTADVVIVASLIIAACSLAVSTAAGVGERRRPFSLLRLTGVPTSLVHRVVALESALPLVLVAAVSVAVGLGSAALYLHSQVGVAFSFPGVSYWATIAGGIAASLAIVVSTFPLLDRVTGPEVARNE